MMGRRDEEPKPKDAGKDYKETRHQTLHDFEEHYPPVTAADAPPAGPPPPPPPPSPGEVDEQLGGG